MQAAQMAAPVIPPVVAPAEVAEDELPRKDVLPVEALEALLEPLVREPPEELLEATLDPVPVEPEPLAELARLPALLVELKLRLGREPASTAVEEETVRAGVGPQAHRVSAVREAKAIRACIAPPKEALGSYRSPQKHVKDASAITLLAMVGGSRAGRLRVPGRDRRRVRVRSATGSRRPCG